MTSMPAVRDLNKLNTFVRVAERRSFTKAARDLRTTPSVISKHITELEDTLGFSLLNRSTHGVTLTEVGNCFFRSCLHMLKNIDDFVTNTRNLQTGPYGTLRVQASAGYARWILAPLIAPFVRQYPQIRVDLITESSTQNPIDDGCDVVVANKKPHGPGLVGRDIGTTQYAICASPEYFKEHGRPKKPQDLRNHNCLVNSLFAPREWTFKDGSKEIVVEVKGTFSSNSSAILTRVAVDGLGIVRVPRFTVRKELEDGQLESVFDKITSSRERVRAYYSKTKYLPAKTTAFVEFLTSSIGSERI